MQEYGKTSSCTAAKSYTEKTDTIQNQAMHMMAGATNSTSICALETATGQQALKDRRSIKVLNQAEQFKRLTDYPMHSRMSKLTEKKTEEVQLYPS